jgi:hypothetical protein
MKKLPLALLLLMASAVLAPALAQTKLTHKEAGEAMTTARVETAVAAFSAGLSSGGRINNQHH